MEIEVKAMSDEKIFKINAEGELFIIDENRTQKEQKIGALALDSQEKEEIVEQLISLRELKNIFVEDQVLSEPEKFMQIIMSKTQYTKEHNWVQELEIEDDHYEKDRRFDFACVLGDSKTIIAGIENKHADFSQDKKKTRANFQDQIKAGFSQLKNYFDNVAKRQSNVLIGAVYVYDANFFFNNPNHINNITHYIYYNTDFFKTLNIVYDPKKQYSHVEADCLKEMQIQGSGLIDVLKIESYHFTKEIQETFVLVKPEELRKLNRESNPRSEALAKSTALARDIVKNIVDATEENLEYFATKYTNEKQINSFEGLSNINIKGFGNLIYGHGLSLSNGQHSNASYFYIYQILNDIDVENYSASYFDSLKADIENLKNVFKEKGVKIKNFNKRLILKAKVTEAYSKKEEHALQVSSNTGVGNVDTNITSLIDFIHKANDALYVAGYNIQISIPRIPKMEGFIYIDYDLLPLLKSFESSNAALASFRQRGFAKVEDFKNDIFDLKKEKAKIAKAKQDKQKLEEEVKLLDEEINEVPEGSRIYDRTMNEIIELRGQISDIDKAIYRFSNFDFEIKNSFYDKTINRIKVFATIFEKCLELNVNDKKILNVSKLAYLLLNQLNKQSDIKLEEHIETAIVYSDYLNKDLVRILELEDQSINKNSIYNGGKKGVGNEINIKVLDYILNNDISFDSNNTPDINKDFEKEIKDFIVSFNS
tara:strand:- start:25703 stop:27832 length:2130 start_codon:yes stop_codon:yes gene_type:complete